MTINPHSLFLTCFISLAANHTQSCRQTFCTLFWGPSHALGPPARHSLEGSWDEGDKERVIKEPLGAAPVLAHTLAGPLVKNLCMKPGPLGIQAAASRQSDES